MTDNLRHILIVGLIFLVALIIGLFLRYKLVARLKQNTAVDAWLIQTTGILLVLILLIIAAVASTTFFSLWNSDLIKAWQSITSLIGDPYIFFRNLALTILAIALGFGIARTARNLALRGLETNRIDINIRTLIGRIFFIVIIVFTIFYILSVWSIPLEVPVAGISVITLIITVSIQDILKDLVAGFYILLERPFFIGQLISTATYTGQVRDVQLRATKLRLLSGEEVMIPNSLVFGGVVINNSHYAERRASIQVILPHADFSKDETSTRILDALKDVEHVMDKPEPIILFSSYQENKVTLILRFWIATEQPAVVTNAMHQLIETLPHADLTVTEFAGNI